MQKVVINHCYGGFDLSEAAYEKLIEWDVPVRKYMKQERDPGTGLYKPQPLNDGEVIFDRELTPSEEDEFSRIYHEHKGKSQLTQRYWTAGWLDNNRSHPLLIRVVEELGAGHRTGASGPCADLQIVEIPDDVEYIIEEYDGLEHIAEAHRTWR